jgi:hypothetical protein
MRGRLGRLLTDEDRRRLWTVARCYYIALPVLFWVGLHGAFG